jgi:RNA polymerase sigma-70 factor, ECF subfamily
MDELAGAAFRRHYDQVFRFVRRRSGSDEEAEEIAQSVFAQAAAQLDPVRQGSRPLLAWLYSVAQRRLIDEARRRARHGVSLPLDEALVGAPEQEYGGDVAAVLRNALDGLSRPQREVVVLRLIQGRSFEEIAARIGSTEAACKMRFVRGLSIVRDVFEKEGMSP